MNVFEQARANIKLARGPRRLADFLVQAKIGDCLPRAVELALLLVVIEDARHRVKVFWIGVLRRAGLVQKLAKALRFPQQIEVALNEFRVPQRLEALLINHQTLAHRPLSILDHGFRFHRENLVARKLLVVAGNQLRRRGVLLLRNQELQETSVERRLLRIARDPGAVLRDRIVLREALILNNFENALKSAP